MKLDLRKKIQLCIVRVCFESKQGNDTQTCDKKAWNYHAYYQPIIDDEGLTKG